MEEEYEKAAIFLKTAMEELCRLELPSQTKVMDFGCGSGELTDHFLLLGYDAHGCDVKPYWQQKSHAAVERLATISLAPYRLPYESGTFDVVVSTSVLEHAQNKEELFREIHRVLKVGGYSMHIFPSKWYLPAEPHIYVPLVNFLWPKCPWWWLAVWALIGVRNEFQQDKSWKEVAEANYEYCKRGLSSWSNRRYRELSRRIFGNYLSPSEFSIHHGYGGCRKTTKKISFPAVFWLVAWRIEDEFHHSAEAWLVSERTEVVS